VGYIKPKFLFFSTSDYLYIGTYRGVRSNLAFDAFLIPRKIPRARITYLDLFYPTIGFVLLGYYLIKMYFSEYGTLLRICTSKNPVTYDPAFNWQKCVVLADICWSKLSIRGKVV
jgi:hypothetical protein